ncbi:MAG: hypothetical protein ABI562_00750 [Chloroflexota bacterium]
MDPSNRDLAFLIWLGVIALAGLRWRPIREMAGVLVRVLRFLRYAIAAFAIYIGALVLLAQKQGLWDTRLLKETLVWFVLPGIPLLFRFTQAWEGRPFYVRTLVGAVSLSAIVEFYVGLGSFSLPVELLLLPLITFLAVFSTVALAKPETRQIGKIAGAVMALLGLGILASATLAVINRPQMNFAEILGPFGLSFFLTAAALPFVFVFSLAANYHDTFSGIDEEIGGDKRARRRAKAAVLASFGLRNRQLHNLTPMDVRELARTKRWAEARHLIAYQRAVVREREAKQDLAAKRLIRYAGVEGTDWEGRPLDQRESEETKHALNRLAMFHGARFENGCYRADLMELVGGLLSETFPETEITMVVHEKGRSWYAWRRTIAGWCLGIGAAGPPPQVWTYEGLEPPSGFPRAGTDWRPGGDFADGGSGE